jgi:hypothetical protein
MQYVGYYSYVHSLENPGKLHYTRLDAHEKVQPNATKIIQDCMRLKHEDRV